MIGKSLLHYEISAQLGRGGMGEVYRAKDTKLGRDVAIKVLPEEFALDTDRVARFQREAKLLASLNHPNIAAIHGLEESHGTHFLVLELIEGDTLSDRIKSGPIPVKEALKLALQMAEALEAAHENGVIHRDLKPANIKVTPDGKVKILDFGLAKAYAGDQENLSPLDSPTISAAATQQGVILGTAAYMSPEQARGDTVDRKADIWAFGVVLFEMLTGRQVFKGKTVSDTLASVLAREPEWNGLPPNLHPRIRFLLERCLEKETRNRYHDIADSRLDIQKVLADPGGVLVQPVPVLGPQVRLRLVFPLTATTLILGLIIAGVAVWYLKPAEPNQVLRFDYHLPEDQEFTGGDYGKRLTVSPDGTKIVYVANEQLYLKNSNELNARPIQGTDENPADPFFSPDGLWVGYISMSETDNFQLRKISIMGGASVKLCEVVGVAGATWGGDDMIVFGQPGSIMRVSARGGTAEEIVKGQKNEWLCWPQILPGGKSVLFSVPAEEGFQVAVKSLESEERKLLFPGGPARYLPTGHIVYELENNLTAIRFDLDTLETMGGPVQLIEDVFRLWPNRTTHVGISDSGTLVYIPGRMGSNIQGTLVWVDHEGKDVPIEEEPEDYGDLKISPDGTRVALGIAKDGNQDIWIYDLFRKTTTRLTFNEADEFSQIWTPDGQRIIFGSGQSIFWKSADGTGNVEQIASMEDATIWPYSISKDGNTLFFWTIKYEAGLYNIGMLSMEGDRTPKLLLQEDYGEVRPQISPDGRWLAYVSSESGQWEVFVRQFPDVDSGGRWQVSTNGGGNPLWSVDGKELFYSSSDGAMAVSVETDPVFHLGTPENLFSMMEPFPVWDIHPDGERFLMLKRVEAEEDESQTEDPRRIIIVQNWFEELKE